MEDNRSNFLTYHLDLQDNNFHYLAISRLQSKFTPLRDSVWIVGVISCLCPQWYNFTSVLINLDLVFVCFALEYFTVDWNFIMYIVMNSFTFNINVFLFVFN